MTDPTDQPHTDPQQTDPPNTDQTSPTSTLEPVLRETILWRFHDPHHARILRELGDMVLELARESHQWGAMGDRPLAFGQVEAASRDLDYLVEFLVEVAASRTRRSDLPAEEVAVCRAASGWARRLARIATEMKQAVGGAG